MKNEYTEPTIQSLGTLKELTADPENPNGCFGNGQEKVFSATDGNGHAQTGCAVS